MRSSTFAVGGQNWCIRFYPKGCWCWGKHDDSETHISVFIKNDRLCGGVHKGVNVTAAKVSILDHAGMPSYTQTTTVENQGFDLGWGKFMSHQDLHEEKHLKDDCLTVLCDLTVTMDVSPMPPFDLRGQLAEAIWNKETPDVKIEAGGETFAAHRWLLEARSPVFKADLSRARRTDDFDDDKTAKLLRVVGMDAEAFKALLQFLYTDSPPETSLLDQAFKAERLLAAADRYELDKLKLICEEALCRHISMGSVASTLALAERHRCPVLWEACMQFLSSHGNFQAFVATDGFEHLKTACPSALLELVMKKMTRDDMSRESCSS
jgi:speckle-type POZ protein